MTLMSIMSMVQSWAAEHKYQLARSEIEVVAGIVNDRVGITASTFPAVDTGDVIRKTRVISLPELIADPRTHDTMVGASGVVGIIIGELIAAIAEEKAHVVVVQQEGPGQARDSGIPAGQAEPEVDAPGGP